VWDCLQVEIVDPGEVGRVAGVQRQAVRDRDRSNHCVKGPRRRFAASPAERCRDATERSGCGSVKWQRIEVGLGLLDVSETGGSL
jgi:hypothetical protein